MSSIGFKKLVVMKIMLLIVSLVSYLGANDWKQHVYSISRSSINFKSDAPLELITASSSKAIGLIDPQRDLFAFLIPVSSFSGFNSPLQREHFNENYLETGKFPNASFKGKIEGQYDFSRDGKYYVKGVGTFSIHGISVEREIDTIIIVKDRKISVQSEFVVFLSDHKIKVPSIVSQKIASSIDVSFIADFVIKQ